MKTFKIAMAQISSIKGEVNLNVDTHLNAISKASTKDVSILIFPELSLTGYEPELAKTLAFSDDDPRLSRLIRAAKDSSMYLVVGAPLRNGKSLEIGAIVISPNGKIMTYSKMNLHPGEEVYFSEGSSHLSLEIDGKKVAIAICADTNNPKHIKTYVDKGCDVYVAGIVFSEGCYDDDTETLKNYALEHKMLVGIANHNAPTGRFLPIGKSAIWDQTGLLVVAGEVEDSMVIAESKSNGWFAEVVEI